MVQPEKQNATVGTIHFETSLLRALISATSEIWVFLDAGDRRIRCCSSKFLSLWKIPEKLAVTGVELLNTDAMGDVTAVAPWNRDLPAFGKCMDRIRAIIARKEVNAAGDRCRISSHVVFDDTGLPLGSLVFLQPPSESKRTFASLSGELPTDAIEALTPRELDVLRRLYNGTTNRAIALQCCISEKTVEKHRSAAMKKLKVTSFSQLVRLLTLAELTYGPDWFSVEHTGVSNMPSQ